MRALITAAVIFTVTASSCALAQATRSQSILKLEPIADAVGRADWAAKNCEAVKRTTRWHDLSKSGERDPNSLANWFHASRMAAYYSQETEILAIRGFGLFCDYGWRQLYGPKGTTMKGLLTK